MFCVSEVFNDLFMPIYDVMDAKQGIAVIYDFEFMVGFVGFLNQIG